MKNPWGNGGIFILTMAAVVASCWDAMKPSEDWRRIFAIKTHEVRDLKVSNPRRFCKKSDQATMFWWFDWTPTKWPLVPGRTNFVMEIQLGLWEGLFCMWFGQWWYLFWVPFFANICADFHWSPMVVTGDVILPPCCFRTESAWFPIPQMLKTTGGRRGMTRNDKDEGCCYPTLQATNKRLDAFLPLQLGKKGNQFWPRINEKPKANVPSNPKKKVFTSGLNERTKPPTYGNTLRQAKQNFQKFPCLPPKTFNFLSKPL